MKKFLLISGAALFMVACNQVPDQVAGTSASNYIQQQVQPVPDTAGLASFQAWKAQNELADIQEFQSQKAVASAPVKKQTAKATPVKRSTPRTQKSSAPSQSTASNESNAGSGTMNNESSGTAQAEKKEGWSKAAKGAVIGGVAGAAGGAVINKKNRVVGAVVGAVIGAGGGYVIGRQMDKKDGRIEYSLK